MKTNKNTDVTNLKNEDEGTQPIQTFEKLHDKKVSEMSRRDMLATGLIPFAASIAAPSILTMLSQSSHAQTSELVCKILAAAPMCPILSINCAGGAAMSANFLPRAQDGNFLKSYSKLGMGKVAPYTQEFKPDSNGQQAVFYRDSSMLAGIRSVATPQTLLETHFVGVCIRAQDDSATNMANIDGLVLRGGRAGNLMKNMGQAQTVTGASQLAAYETPPTALRVNSLDDIRNALGFSGTLAQLSEPQKGNLVRTISSLSDYQMNKYFNQSGGKTLGRLLGCANQDNTKLIAEAASLDLDPRRDAQISTLYVINNNTAANNNALVSASLVYNALKENAATANLVIGGCDYHNGTRTAGDARDLQIGMEIGRALQMASILKKKFFLMVTSDGAVTGPESDVAGGVWSTDNGSAGVAYMFAYDPDQKSRANTTQLGWFNEAQAAADNFVWGTNVAKAAAAIYVNYLSFNNQLGLVETVLPRVFESHEIDKIAVLFAS